jgi:hypothetical protein
MERRNGMPFKKAQVETAFLKAGFFGFQGTGKTWTAVHTAIGLHKLIGSQKPVCFTDTETGSDFHVKRFENAGIGLEVSKTRAFADLISDAEAALKISDIWIIDSISHFWKELLSSWKKKRGRTFVSIRDFGPLKEEWGKFSAFYVNAPIHIIMCGRASNIFEDIEDEDEASGMRAVKVGEKMAAETETGYEPSLLVWFQREMMKDGGKYARVATVIKDRTGVLDGKEFTNPTFDDFLPHIKMLNIGGDHVGFDASRSSETYLQDPERSITERKKQQDILMERLEALKVKYLPGSSNREKIVWVVTKEVAFGTASETEIAGKSIAALKTGLELVELILQRYEEMIMDGGELPIKTQGDFRRWAENIKTKWAEMVVEAERSGK